MLLSLLRLKYENRWGLLPTKYENQEDKLLAQGVFRGILLAGSEKSLKGGETIESGYRSLWMG